MIPLYHKHVVMSLLIKEVIFMKNQDKQHRRYVAVGDLAVDCYWDSKQKEIMLISGGGSSGNVISNLASRGQSAAVIGGCGNDLWGDLAIHQLEELGVDTQGILRKGGQTRIYHLCLEGDAHKSLKNCPICGQYSWYEKAIGNFSHCQSYLLPQDIIILDGLKPENIEVLTQCKNEKVLDLGRVKRLKELTDKELMAIFQIANLQILQLNESVEKYLYLRFHLANVAELYELCHARLLVITRGRAGADFVTKHEVYHQELCEFTLEVDDTGAGDAFFSQVIESFFDHKKQVSRLWVTQTFFAATELTRNVVSNLGARGHLIDGFVPESNFDMYQCICHWK